MASPCGWHSELLLQQSEPNFSLALSCCRCRGGGRGGEQRLVQPRFRGAAHSVCVSGRFAGQGEREGVGDVLGMAVLPTSLGRGAGTEGTDKLLRAPMAGVCRCCQSELVPVCLVNNTTRSAWWNLPVNRGSLPEQGNAKTGLAWTRSSPTPSLAWPVLMLRKQHPSRVFLEESLPVFLSSAPSHQLFWLKYFWSGLCPQTSAQWCSGDARHDFP